MHYTLYGGSAIGLLLYDKYNIYDKLTTRVHSSVVEHLTADQEVTGSNPVGPSLLFFLLFLYSHPYDNNGGNIH
jgi:hypothetical protein